MAASDWPVLRGQGFKSKKAPTFKTRVKQATSGREYRNPRWSYPLWRFRVGYEVLRDRPSLAELSMLLAFFGTQQGQSASFNYLDPDDNAVTDARFGTGDGSTKTFQLSRTISSTIGAVTKTWTEPIFAVSGSPTNVKVAGTPTAAYTIGSNGLLTFTSAPAAAAALTWTGSFLFVCRFEQDEIEPEQMVKDLWSLSGLEFVSIKP